MAVRFQLPQQSRIASQCVLPLTSRRGRTEARALARSQEVQNVRSIVHSQSLQRLTAVTVGAALLLATAAAPYRANAQTPTPTPAPASGPVVLVGSGEPGYSVNAFGPKA